MKEQINDYINKLKELEQQISSDEDIDFVDGLDSLLKSLTSDVQTSAYAINSSLEIKIKKLNDNAIIPSYSKDGDAGMDLTAISIEHTENYISYKTGLAFEIPKGYVGLLFPRSSNSKKDLLLTNSVGVIDSGYRGEVEVRYKWVGHCQIPNITHPNLYNVGERIGQIIILPYPQIKFIETDVLSETVRGEGGYGSTGI